MIISEIELNLNISCHPGCIYHKGCVLLRNLDITVELNCTRRDCQCSSFDFKRIETSEHGFVALHWHDNTAVMSLAALRSVASLAGEELQRMMQPRGID